MNNAGDQPLQLNMTSDGRDVNMIQTLRNRIRFIVTKVYNPAVNPCSFVQNAMIQHWRDIRTIRDERSCYVQ